jgi:DNA-directed RNA polymerase III subunit RPC3
VLIQHNILWHAHAEDEGEMLEFNTLECLLRLRFGRYVWQAENLFGHTVRIMRHSRTFFFPVPSGRNGQLTDWRCPSSSKGAEIVQLILDHGKLRPPDIISRLSVYDPKSAPFAFLHFRPSVVPTLLAFCKVPACIPNRCTS